jgi:hypothetical protein
MEDSIFRLGQDKVLSYLNIYGSTRESDLIAYATQKLSLSEEEARKMLDNMLLYGRLERVLHKDLDPPVVYFKYGWTVDIERDMRALSESIRKAKSIKEKNERVKEILREAEYAARKKRTKSIRAKGKLGEIQ